MREKYIVFPAAILVVAATAITIWLYPHLPDRIPVHWDPAGHADGYMDKVVGVSVIPVTMAVLAVVFACLPRLAGISTNLNGFIRTYSLVTHAILAALFCLQLVVLALGDDIGIGIPNLVPVTLGLLMIGLGNYLGKFQRNSFVGIRTPWTLADPEVWSRTHRVGGKVFALAGGILLVEGALATSPAVVIGTIVVAAGYLVVYSYVIRSHTTSKHHGS